MHPKVSIIIPVYNGADYLGEAIDSALAQTYPNLEVIVINDGSSDEGATEGVALKYGSRITYYHKENGGVASALNLGISKMRGDYFAWLSHDDIFYANKIELQLKHYALNGWIDYILFSDYDFIDEKSQVTRQFQYVPIKKYGMALSLILSHPVNGCTVLIPAKILKAGNLFNETLRYTQDYDLWFRLAQNYEFRHLPERLVGYREHPVQGSRAQSSKHFNEIKHYYEMTVAHCVDSGIMTSAILKDIMQSFEIRNMKALSDYSRRYFLKSTIKKKVRNAMEFFAK